MQVEIIPGERLLFSSQPSTVSGQLWLAITPQAEIVHHPMNCYEATTHIDTVRSGLHASAIASRALGNPAMTSSLQMLATAASNQSQIGLAQAGNHGNTDVLYMTPSNAGGPHPLMEYNPSQLSGPSYQTTPPRRSPSASDDESPAPHSSTKRPYVEAPSDSNGQPPKQMKRTGQADGDILEIEMMGSQEMIGPQNSNGVFTFHSEASERSTTARLDHLSAAAKSQGAVYRHGIQEFRESTLSRVFSRSSEG